MSATLEVLTAAADRPSVELLDARTAGLDAAGLRRWARSRAAGTPGGLVARSYRHPFALVASHSQRVGVDIERVDPFDRAFAQSICTPAERSAGLAGSADKSASVWCSKEALSKALGDAMRYDPRRLEAPLDWPGGRAGRWRAMALAAPTGHVAWVCWLDQSAG